MKFVSMKKICLKELKNELIFILKSLRELMADYLQSQ